MNNSPSSSVSGNFGRFFGFGLILGLFNEFELRIVAGLKPQAFGAALVFYPILVTLSHGMSRLVDRRSGPTWSGDLRHYFGSGALGMGIEWTLLGNAPGGNAIQIGMWAMWTTFCFGPRVLSRGEPQQDLDRFWRGFKIASLAITALILLSPERDAKVVVATLGLTAIHIVWSLQLLFLARRFHRSQPPPLSE